MIDNFNFPEIDCPLIDLSDYTLSGGGANGESYDYPADPTVMLKLYFPGKMRQSMDELELARKVYALGIPTPEPGELVRTSDGRYGIKFHRILGKKSFARACGDEPSRAGEFGEEFAHMCLSLHAVHVDTSMFTCVKDKYYSLLEVNPYFNKTEREKLGAFISNAPDSDIAIHGDLQFGNVIFVGGKHYFIDLGDFCYGYPLFDVGMVYLTSILNEEAFLKETFHMDKPTARTFWQGFASVYFSGIPLPEAEEIILPYAGLKTLIVERDTKRPMPEFRAALKSIL